ncbi:MAG: restriction endonuclease subunit S [Thermoplasmatales archaeon]|nr:restriction endonuclease subunit S [Thermoplasmatales archaeon]
MKSEIEVPDGWNSSELKKMGLLIMGQSPKGDSYNKEGVGLPLLNGANDLTSGGILINQYTSKPTKICNKGDILFCIRATIGNITISDREYCLGRGVAAIRPKEDFIKKEFLVHKLSSKFEHMKKISTGAVIKGVKKSDIEEFQMLIPVNIDEQQKIADILSKVDEQTKLTEKIIDKTEELKKGLMQKLLTKGIGHTKFKKNEFGEIPEEWEGVKQGDVAKFINGRAYKLSEWEKSGTPVIRLQNLTGSGTTFYYSTLKLDSKQYVEDGDLLYMWSASFGPHIWHGPRAIYHYHIWKIICGEKIDKIFMFYNLNNITNIMRNQMHGMAMLHITKAKMEKQKMMLPPLNEQKQIASILSKVDDQIQDNKKEQNHLEELKKGLMQDLLTGKVRVSV